VAKAANVMASVIFLMCLPRDVERVPVEWAGAKLTTTAILNVSKVYWQ